MGIDTKKGHSYDRGMQISSLQTFCQDFSIRPSFIKPSTSRRKEHTGWLHASIHHPFGLTSWNRAKRREKSCRSTAHLPLLPILILRTKSMKRILYTWQQYRSTRRQTWINKAFRYATKTSSILIAIIYKCCWWSIPVTDDK